MVVETEGQLDLYLTQIHAGGMGLYTNFSQTCNRDLGHAKNALVLCVRFHQRFLSSEERPLPLKMTYACTSANVVPFAINSLHATSARAR